MSDPIETVVIGRADGVVPERLATRGEHVPDILVRVMSPIAVVFVRTLRVYLQSLIGFIGFGAAAHILPGDLVLTLKGAAGLALAPAMMCALQNSIELLARLDEKLPQLRP